MVLPITSQPLLTHACGPLVVSQQEGSSFLLTLKFVWDVLDGLLVQEGHGRFGGKREGAEVVPAILGPAHKQLQGGVEEGQAQPTQALVLRLGDAGGREGGGTEREGGREEGRRDREGELQNFTQ